MGLRTDISDLLWSTSPAGAARLLAAADGIGFVPRILESLRYQSEFFCPAKPFPCWWFRNPLPGNAGDLLTPLLLEGLFGVSPIFSNGREFLGAGSVVKQARRHSVVWGSGLMSPDIRVAPGPTFLAVRGPLSREALLAQGHAVPATYGDPAILMPAIYDPPRPATRWRLGFIPHFTHRGRLGPLPDDVSEISILRGTKADLLALIDDILAAEMIVSSSLHGLILALAYGKPAAWVRLPGPGLKGDTFKFDDFLASVGAAGTGPIDVSDANGLVALGAKDTVHSPVPEALKNGLIASFRACYDVRPDAVVRRT